MSRKVGGVRGSKGGRRSHKRRDDGRARRRAARPAPDCVAILDVELDRTIEVAIRDETPPDVLYHYTPHARAIEGITKIGIFRATDYQHVGDERELRHLDAELVAMVRDLSAEM